MDISHLTGMDRLRAHRGLMARVAEQLGVSRSAVAMWQEVPAGRLLDVERITGIPREQLRPDLYERLPPPSQDTAA